MSAAYGEDVIVKKVRELFLVGRIRIHLDSVEWLGDFVELEVMLKDGEDPETGLSEANGLMEKLGIDEVDLIAGAYADLLREGAPSR